MTQNKFITEATPASRERGVTCTVPNTYQEEIPGQVRPSCGFYAGACVLNCLNGVPNIQTNPFHAGKKIFSRRRFKGKN